MLMSWPKPKIEHGTVTYYVTKKLGTTTHGPTGDTKVTTKCVTTIHKPLYLVMDLNTQENFAVGICGKFVYLPHKIHLHSAKKSMPLVVVTVAYGWGKIWWKPWKYLSFNLPKS